MQKENGWNIESVFRAVTWKRNLPIEHYYKDKGLPSWCSGKETTCQCRRCKRPGFDPWVRKMPWRRRWQPTPVFLPGSPTSDSPWGLKELDATEQLIAHTDTHTHRIRLRESYRLKRNKNLLCNTGDTVSIPSRATKPTGGNH